MNFDKEEIVAACREYGPQIVGLPVGIDGAQLLWAMSGNESSFGANCAPRHEPAFDVDGVYGSGPVMTPLLAKFGSAAAGTGVESTSGCMPSEVVFASTSARTWPS